HAHPAARRRKRSAVQALRLLDREFFRRHHRLAEYYSEHITRNRRGPAWVLGLLARQSPHPVRTALDTSSSRLHDREEDLQAASSFAATPKRSASMKMQDDDTCTLSVRLGPASPRCS